MLKDKPNTFKDQFLHRWSLVKLLALFAGVVSCVLLLSATVFRQQTMMSSTVRLWMCNGQPQKWPDNVDHSLWHQITHLSASVGSGPMHSSPSWYARYGLSGTAVQIGVRNGQSTKLLASIFKTVHVLDWAENVNAVADMMKSLKDAEEYGTVVPHGHTHKTSDSYVYSLKDLLRSSSRPRLDYAFVDGLHTWYHDGFVFFLLDKMLNVGGILEFDGSRWKFADSPDSEASAYGELFRPPEGKAAQINDVLELLVERSGRYEVVAKRRIYRKLAHVGQCCKPVPQSTDDKMFTGKAPWYTSNRTAAAEFGIDLGQTTKKLSADFKNVHIFDFECRVGQIKELIESANNSGKMATVIPHASSYRVLDSYTYTLKAMLQQTERPGPSFNYVFSDAAHEWHHDGFLFFLIDMFMPVGSIIAFDDYPWTIAGSPSVNPKVNPGVLERFTMKQLETPHVKEIVDLLVDEDPRYRVLERGWRPVFHKVAETDGCCRDVLGLGTGAM